MEWLNIIENLLFTKFQYLYIMDIYFKVSNELRKNKIESKENNHVCFIT